MYFQLPCPQAAHPCGGFTVGDGREGSSKSKTKQQQKTATNTSQCFCKFAPEISFLCLTFVTCFLNIASTKALVEAYLYWEVHTAHLVGPTMNKFARSTVFCREQMTSVANY